MANSKPEWTTEETRELDRRLILTSQRLPWRFLEQHVKVDEEGIASWKYDNRKIDRTYYVEWIADSVFNIRVEDVRINDLEAIQLSRYILFLIFESPFKANRRRLEALAFWDFNLKDKWSIEEHKDWGFCIQLKIETPDFWLRYLLADYDYKKCQNYLCKKRLDHMPKDLRLKCSKCWLMGFNVYFCNSACFQEGRFYHSLMGYCKSSVEQVTMQLPSVEVSCALCGRAPVGKPLRCSKCYKFNETKVYYCDKTCQLGDWREHKIVCGQSKRIWKPDPPSASVRASASSKISEKLPE